MDLKKIIPIIAGICVALSLMSSSPASGHDDDTFEAQLNIEKRGINLGNITRSSTPISLSFTGVNTGNAPLVLTYVHPSCNCVRLKYPREPIAPGDTLYIRGTLNPQGLSEGQFRRDIIIRSNATESKIRLIMTGTIVPDSITIIPDSIR